MSTGMDQTKWTKAIYQERKHFSIICRVMIYQTKIISMLNKFGELLIFKIWENIMAYIWKLMFFYWLTFLKILGKSVSIITISILFIIIRPPVLHGMAC